MITEGKVVVESGHFGRSVCGDTTSNVVFSDVSDGELVSPSHEVENNMVTQGKVVDESRSFGEPLSDDKLQQLNLSRFAKRTADKALWAVTPFGEWRGQRNCQALEKP
jgi:hypothetical protein